MSTRITGYLLLTIGLLAITYSAFSIYRVFTGSSDPIAVFDLPGLSLNLPLSLAAQSTAEIYPASAINRLTNFFTHYMLMSFFVSVGFRISSLGVQLLRPVEVKLRATNSASASSLQS